MAGHRLGALEVGGVGTRPRYLIVCLCLKGGGGRTSPPFQCIPGGGGSIGNVVHGTVLHRTSGASNRHFRGRGGSRGGDKRREEGKAEWRGGKKGEKGGEVGAGSGRGRRRRPRGKEGGTQERAEGGDEAGAMQIEEADGPVLCIPLPSCVASGPALRPSQVPRPDFNPPKGPDGPQPPPPPPQRCLPP